MAWQTKSGSLRMPGQNSLVRQWTLLRILCCRRMGATVKELAQEAGVNEKTIRRDLETFQTAGFPLEETVGPHGRKTYRLSPTAAQPPLGFPLDEAMALYLGQRFLEPLAGTVFWEAANRAFRKIRGILGPAALRYVDRLGVAFYHSRFGAVQYAAKAEMLDTLTQAIADRQSVFLTYQSLRSTEPVTYDVYPYGLVYHLGRIYLIGWAPRREAIRTWRVDRMLDVQRAELQFPRPERFDLEKYINQAFGIYHGDEQIAVRIRFSRTVARYVKEATWHPSQKLVPQPDGSLLAEFTLGTTEEIKHWILSFGKEAEVLAPDSLRAALREELAEMMDTYQLRPARATKIRNTEHV